MSYVLTNKTAHTPLGFGALGVVIEPGESLTITRQQSELISEHPVVASWIKEGKLGVELEDTIDALAEEALRLAAERETKRLADDAEAARLAAEEAAKLAAPEVLVTPPKVPTPTAKK